MTQAGIHKCLKAMQALRVSVIFAEYSFRESPCNTQCSNATEINCKGLYPAGQGYNLYIVPRVLRRAVGGLGRVHSRPDACSWVLPGVSRKKKKKILFPMRGIEPRPWR